MRTIRILLAIGLAGLLAATIWAVHLPLLAGVSVAVLSWPIARYIKETAYEG